MANDQDKTDDNPSDGNRQGFTPNFSSNSPEIMPTIENQIQNYIAEQERSIEAFKDEFNRCVKTGDMSSLTTIPNDEFSDLESSLKQIERYVKEKNPYKIRDLVGCWYAQPGVKRASINSHEDVFLKLFYGNINDNNLDDLALVAKTLLSIANSRIETHKNEVKNPKDIASLDDEDVKDLPQSMQEMVKQMKAQLEKSRAAELSNFWGKEDGSVKEDDVLTIEFGGGVRFLTAFLSGKEPGYSDDRKSHKGIYVTPLLNKDTDPRTPDYAARSPIKYFDAPIYLKAKIEAKYLKAADNGYEAFLYDPSKIKEIVSLKVYPPDIKNNIFKQLTVSLNDSELSEELLKAAEEVKTRLRLK